MLLKLRSVRLRDYIAGLEDSRGERLQTREFIAGAGVTVGKDDDSVWISGPKRTIVIPWSSVLQCELDTEWWDAGGGDTDAAQVQAYGDRASDVGGGVLPWVPSANPLATSVYPNEAEQRTQAEPVSVITQALEAAGAIERIQPDDSVSTVAESIAAWDAVKTCEAEIQAAHAEVALAMAEVGESAHTDVDTPSQPVHTEVDAAPKPLSRKNRRKRR